ncbi:MAG: DUF805 domain-containing protein [Parvibaculum sp.]|uniref:DUF805 domain-containing protein n=1 Tax=Parvibaculum sp. TaxID=2024848 RepID=UPI003C77E879
MGLTNILVSFEGRINRRPIWAFTLFAAAVNAALGYVAYHYMMQIPVTPGMTADELLQQVQNINLIKLVGLILLWPWLALSVKRAHDRDRSGWFLLLFLVPILNIWPAIELTCVAGTPGSNRFGTDPLADTPRNGLGWLIFIGIIFIIAMRGYSVFKFTTFMMHQMEGTPGSQVPNGRTPNPSLQPIES